MSDNYHQLASLYDQLQGSLDYPAWADFILGLDRRHSSRRPGPGDGREGRPLLLDLGCGTGSFAFEMERRGYDVIGIDRAAPMLQQARDKAQAIGSQALFLQQDISRFELYGTVDLAVCLLDTLNHLIRPLDVERLFRLLANYLNPGCLFIFDVGSSRHFAKTLGNRVFYEDTDRVTLFWVNRFRPASGISRSALTWFVRDTSGRYERFDEEIIERYYNHLFLLKAAQQAGLEFVTRTGELSDGLPQAGCERLFDVFRRRSQTDDSNQ
jgi:SAM-dependent methyltransferase